MGLVQMRRTALILETICHEGGPPPDRRLRQGCALAVMCNPYAGRYELDLMPFMAELRNLGEPKAIVPASKAVASAGYRLMVPLHGIHAAYVRSHFNAMEVGTQDGPHPDEIVFALVMATGGRIHARLGGLGLDGISAHGGQH